MTYVTAQAIVYSPIRHSQDKVRQAVVRILGQANASHEDIKQARAALRRPAF
jgi:hypothetical protein